MAFERSEGAAGARIFVVDLASGSTRQLIPDVAPASVSYHDTDLSWSRRTQ